MRVLSRRSNLPKAVACGYCESAGFVVLTEPSPWPLALLLLCGARLVDAAVVRYVPGPRGRAHCLCSRLGHLPLAPNPAHQQRPRLDGVGAATTPPDGIGMVWGPSLLGHWGLPAKSAVRGPSAEAEKSARRRRRAPADDSSRRPRRALPRAGDGWLPPCVVSATEAEAKWHCCGARLHKNCKHGCGEDCSRSASICTARATASAALSAVANASSTSLAYKACV